MTDPSRQLDEISLAIGKFEAYVAEFRAGNLAITELIKANEKLSCQRDELLKEEINQRIEHCEEDHKRLDARVSTLEKDKTRREGAVGVVTWFAKNWPLAGGMTALGGFIAWANGKFW